RSFSSNPIRRPSACIAPKVRTVRRRASRRRRSDEITKRSQTRALDQEDDLFCFVKESQLRREKVQTHPGNPRGSRAGEGGARKMKFANQSQFVEKNQR